MRLAPAVLGLLTAFFLTPAAHAGSCLSGTITSEPAQDPEFEGLTKYTVEFTWDVTGFSTPSHFDLFLALETCDCICDGNVIVFPTPAGTSTGSGPSGPCTVTYDGEFLCDGDPSLPGDTRPVVKWEIPEQECEPDETGSATFCFYSIFDPTGDENTVSAAGIKHGTDFCEGTLTGPRPDCTCFVSVDPATWGTIKSVYRP